MAAQTTPRSLLLAYNPTNYSQKPKLATRWETETQYQFAAHVAETAPAPPASPLAPGPKVRAHPSSIFASLPAAPPLRAPQRTTSPLRPSLLPTDGDLRTQPPSPGLSLAAPPLYSRREYGTGPHLDPAESAEGTAQPSPVIGRAPTPARRSSAPFFCYRSDSKNRKADGPPPAASRQTSPTASRTNSPRRGSTRSTPTAGRPPSPALRRSPTTSSVASALAAPPPEPPLSAWAYIPMPPVGPATGAPHPPPAAAPRGLRVAYAAQPAAARQGAAAQAGGSPTTSPPRQEAGTQVSPRRGSPPRGPEGGSPTATPGAAAPVCPLHQCAACQSLVLSLGTATVGAIPVLWAGHPHPLHPHQHQAAEREAAPPEEEALPPHASIPSALQNMSHTERRNPKRYRGLPQRCTQLIQPAGKPSVPRGLRSSTVSECFHIYD